MNKLKLAAAVLIGGLLIITLLHTMLHNSIQTRYMRIVADKAIDAEWHIWQMAYKDPEFREIAIDGRESVLIPRWHHVSNIGQKRHHDSENAF